MSETGSDKEKSRWGSLGSLVSSFGTSSSADSAATSAGGAATDGGSDGGVKGMKSLCDAPQFHPESGKPIAGSTMASRKRPAGASGTAGTEGHVWGEGDASLFNLRAGPDYAKTGAKAPSADAFYDIVGIDLFECENRMVNAGAQVHLPEEWTSVPTNHAAVPPVLIVCCQLPDVSHALSGLTNFFVDKSEGPGSTVLMFYRIKAATAAALQSLDAGEGEACPPALQLLVDFCLTAKGGQYKYNDPANPMAGRFKVCPKVDNIAELGLPGFITMYNSKPALVAACLEWHYCAKGDYLCLDTNIHAFGGVARSALQLMSFESMVLQWGFALESRGDAQMPERLFGTCYMTRPNMHCLPGWDEALRKGKGIIAQM